MRLVRYTLRLPSRGVAPAHRLQVRNTTVRSRSHAIKFGSNTDTEMSEILFDNVTITVPCPALPCRPSYAPPAACVAAHWHHVVLQHGVQSDQYEASAARAPSP